MQPREKAVFRQLAIPVSVFDHIKDTQRAHEASHGEHLSINDTVALIVRAHQQQQQPVEREARHAQPLRPGGGPPP